MFIIKLIMRIRKNQKNRIDLLTILHPFQQSLMIIINNNNQKAFDQIVKNEYKKAEEYLTVVEKNIKMANHHSVCFCKLKSMYLNNKALVKMKENKNNQALQIIDEVIHFEKKYKLHPIEQARSLLNRAVIFSKIRVQLPSNENRQQPSKNFFAQEQSLRIVKQALELLKTKKHLMTQINQIPKYNQYILLNFCSVAKELSHLKDIEEAGQLYKQGYQLAIKNLGHMHHLTQLLKRQAKIINKNRANTQISDFSIQAQQSANVQQKKSFANSQSKAMSQLIELQLQHMRSKANKKNFRRLKHKNQFSSLSPYQKYHIHSKRLQTENVSTLKASQQQPVQMLELQKIKKLYQIKRGDRKIINQPSLSVPQKNIPAKQISSKNLLIEDLFCNSNIQKKDLIEKFMSMNNKHINKSGTNQYNSNSANHKNCQLI